MGRDVFVAIFESLCVRLLAAQGVVCPIRSCTLRGWDSPARAIIVEEAVKTHRLVTPPGCPSRLCGVVRSCALLLLSEETGNVALNTFAGPTSVLKSTAIASSAAASGANSSILASVQVFFWMNLKPSAPQKCRSNRTHQIGVPFGLCKRLPMCSTLRVMGHHRLLS